MEATYSTHIEVTPVRPATAGLRGVGRAICSAAAAVLVEGVRGDDFAQAFSSVTGAQFAALPASSKQRLLNCGFRP